jgi:hypothetical protein
VTHSTAEINGQLLVKEYDDTYNKASNSVNIDISGSEPNLSNRGLSPITLDESSTSPLIVCSLVGLISILTEFEALLYGSSYSFTSG